MRIARVPQRSRRGWAEFYWRRWCKQKLDTSLHLALWYEILEQQP